jgi:hypothetical protein
MGHLLATLAVGGPGPVLPQGWDAGPLVLAATLTILMRWGRLPVRLGTLFAIALLGGIALDLVGAAVGISTPQSIALLALGFSPVAMRRTRTA